MSGPVAGEKSEGTALALSLGGTVASLAMLAVGENQTNDGLGAIGGIGIWVAPSFGHWYAGKLWTQGLTLRLAAACSRRATQPSRCGRASGPAAAGRSGAARPACRGCHRG